MIAFLFYLPTCL